MKLFLLSFLALVSGADTATLTPVITAISTLIELVGQVFTVMTANPLLVVFLAASLLTLGIRIFRKLKGAAKG